LGDSDLSDEIGINGDPKNKDGNVETLTEAPAYILMSRGPLKKFSTYDDVQKRFNKCREITNLNIQ
jgi:hypothetical protein